MKKVAVGVAAAAAVIALAGCSDESSQTQEINRNQSSYDTLTKNQPAKQMEYSPTRTTVNHFVETWGKDPEKLSYVYIQDGDSNFRYLVLKGLPVSYCAMLTPNYTFIDRPGDGDSYNNYEVPAPGIDGAYYSGNQCQSYYGIDATTGAYVEFSIGNNQSYFLYDQPMDFPGDLVPMGPTELSDVKDN